MDEQYLGARGVIIGRILRKFQRRNKPIDWKWLNDINQEDINKMIKDGDLDEGTTVFIYKQAVKDIRKEYEKDWKGDD